MPVIMGNVDEQVIRPDLLKVKKSVADYWTQQAIG